MSRENLITIETNESWLRKKSNLVDIRNDENLKSNIEVLEKFCKEN